jgi:hypothetical protein
VNFCLDLVVEFSCVGVWYFVPIVEILFSDFRAQNQKQNNPSCFDAQPRNEA